jgi:hypothetical protein
LGVVSGQSKVADKPLRIPRAFPPRIFDNRLPDYSIAAASPSP